MTQAKNHVSSRSPSSNDARLLVQNWRVKALPQGRLATNLCAGTNSRRKTCSHRGNAENCVVAR
jgi:hypothetical protein